MSQVFYFDECNTMEELKAKYKELAKKYHPDLGGDVEIMKIINVQYSQRVFTMGKKEGKTDNEINEDLLSSEAYKKAIDGIISFDDLIIEVCGSWIWVSGNTRERKEALKASGFYYAKNKVKWYFRSEENKTKSTKSVSMDDIRTKYGSTILKSKGNYIK
jgi:hypothetical protein